MDFKGARMNPSFYEEKEKMYEARSYSTRGSGNKQGFEEVLLWRFLEGLKSFFDDKDE